MRLLAMSFKNGGQELMVPISSTVPRTGKIAFVPGNAVDSSNTKALTIKSKKPTSPTNLRALMGGIKTNKAPSPNSHARVGRE